MNTITKTLSIVALLGLAACEHETPPTTTVSAPVADVYVLLFVAHTTQDVPEGRNVGFAIQPHIFATLADCNAAKQQVETSFTTDDGKTWFSKNQIDKEAVVCVPVTF